VAPLRSSGSRVTPLRPPEARPPRGGAGPGAGGAAHYPQPVSTELPPPPDADLPEQIRVRREKRAAMLASGVEPYPVEVERTSTLRAVRDAHPDLPPDTATGEAVAVAGRVMFLRNTGKLCFATLREGDGTELQAMLSLAKVGEEELARWKAAVDLGDHVAVHGEVITSRRGELSVMADRWTMAAKAVRPLPNTHSELSEETRVRQRYVDLLVRPQARDMVRTRAQVVRTLRDVLHGGEFVEVETPMLQLLHGGATARPFVTHANALNQDLYLRIALELFLKRCVVGGVERVFEINRVMRNEGIDSTHSPEFTMLEAYQAYGDYETMMELGQALIREAALAVRGTLRFEYQGREVDLESEWPRRRMLDLVSEATGEEITLERGDLGGVAKAHGIEVEPTWVPGKIVYELYEKLVEDDLWGPMFVLDVPREVSPLARPHRTTPGLVEHVDFVLCGTEIIPAYSELSDPDEQRKSFEIQAAARSEGEEETHPMDEDFLTALEHGMPPAGGLGLGVDRLAMILADAPSIRDVILFPPHRPAGDRE
jgi:lysyl-tRNA synthetase class 2